MCQPEKPQWPRSVGQVRLNLNRSGPLFVVQVRLNLNRLR